MFEENIKLVNELIEEEEKEKKKQEDDHSKSMPDTSSMMKGAGNFSAPNFSMPKF